LLQLLMAAIGMVLETWAGAQRSRPAGVRSLKFRNGGDAIVLLLHMWRMLVAQTAKGPHGKRGQPGGP
jgi:hypothetical protein